MRRRAVHHPGHGKPWRLDTRGANGILRRVGVNDDSVGAPVLATMETAQLGIAENGAAAHVDRFAYEADGIIVLARTKTHPESVGELASGLLKMSTIGLDKQVGAHQAHSHKLWDSVRAVPKLQLKRLLQRTLDTLRGPIRAGVPIIGLEPSCVTVFRDEMTNLVYGEEDAKRMQKQTFILSEFLHEKVPGYKPPVLKRKAIVHGHCHHKSLLHFEKDVDLLKKAGVDCKVPDSGCCGMAGSFGYEADHYKVGLDCGERVLLPTVRNASDEELIVTDGFSCREMILQETDRQALHFAQVLQMALHEGPQGALPEMRYATVERTPAVPTSVVAIAGLALGAGLYWATRRD